MARWTFADLFSGAGGMSYGFFARGPFDVIGAVDAQLGKPSSRRGSLECNTTFSANMGITPFEKDLSLLTGTELVELLQPALGGRRLDVLSACPPCTGFSRANPNNHLMDDPRNSLITRVSDFVAAARPAVVVMENARELVRGNFRTHLVELETRLGELGYDVDASVHLLSRFGLPQKRERALVIAVDREHELRTLDDLWDGWSVDPRATTVRRTIGHLPRQGAGSADPEDPMHISPSIGLDSTRRRLSALPHDGGSWTDLRHRCDHDSLLTPAMHRSIAAGRLGSHPDVYGRMWWDRPAPTVKRECAHFGNGRYSHPEQDRLCTVRELALLSGFPEQYVFRANSLSNMYRHIGDAVPPLVSYQLAAVAEWILGGVRPSIESLILPGTQLTVEDLVPTEPVASEAVDVSAR